MWNQPANRVQLPGIDPAATHGRSRKVRVWIELLKKRRVKPAKLFIGCDPRSKPFVVQKDLAGFGFAKVAASEVFRKISQNFSPAGVTSPFVARAIPTDNTSVVPVSGR